MAMDPFAALGIAANIVQFVDFNWRLVTQARAIHKSGSGASETKTEISLITADIIRLSESIQVSPSSSASLRELARTCKKVADDLIEALAKLKTKGRHPRWESFVIALKEVWANDEIDDFTRRLKSLQDQVALNVQFIILDRQSAVIQEISKMAEEKRKMHLDMNQTMDALRQEVVDKLELVRATSGHLHQPDALAAIQEPRALDSHKLAAHSINMRHLSAAMSRLQVEGLDAASTHMLFKSLFFPKFRVRQDQISRAHAQTFGWIFQDLSSSDGRPVGFRSWLEAGCGIFWVRGKAGSGKSTLMKFLCGHPQTLASLNCWARGKRLTVSRYFFWNSGTSLQKSQEGLLRSILFDILRSCPELIPQVENMVSRLIEGKTAAETRDFEDDEAGSSLWTLDLLRSTLEEILDSNPVERFCFFIDGLDEYKGDNQNLVDMVQHLALCSGVKICLSSRPWTEFVDAFGKDPGSTIKLEDLTRWDITRYVSDVLAGNAKFRKLENYYEEYSDLVTEVVSRAQGVFLWVFLVVRSLLEGVKYADTIEEMRMRLKSFPEDLYEFFKHILQDIPRNYWRQTTQMFQVATASDSALPLMVYSFLDDLDKDSKFALKASPTKPMVAERFVFRVEHMPARLDGRSKGLIEVVETQRDCPFFKYEVDFLHRTVRDFLRSSDDVQNMFDSSRDASFDPSVASCHALLAILKLAPRATKSDGSMNLSDVDYIVECMFRYARARRKTLDQDARLHDVLEETRQTLSVLEVWEPAWSMRDARDKFNCLAVQSGLSGYVDHMLRTGFAMAAPYQESLLHYALKPRRLRRGGVNFYPDVVECLLRHGLDPNDKGWGGSAPWTEFLKDLILSEDLRGEDANEVIKALVCVGKASLHCTVPVQPTWREGYSHSHYDPTCPVYLQRTPSPNYPDAIEVIKQICPRELTEVLVAQSRHREKRPAAALGPLGDYCKKARID